MSYSTVQHLNQNQAPFRNRNRPLITRRHTTLFHPYCDKNVMPFVLIGIGMLSVAGGIYLTKKSNSHPSNCVLRLVKDNSTELNNTFVFEPGCQTPYFISLFINFTLFATGISLIYRGIVDAAKLNCRQ